MERQNWMFQDRLDLCISIPFQVPLFRDSDILWINDHLWTQTTVEKIATGSRHPDLGFSSLYQNQAPLFLPRPKKTLLLKSFLSFWPKFACVARNRDTATASWRGGVMKTNGFLKPWIMCVTIKGEADMPPCWAPINHWEWWRRWELIYTHKMSI